MSDVSVHTSPPLKPTKPFRVFISYARKDSTHLECLRTHLANLTRQGWIETWSDQDLYAGDRWEKELLRKLRSADIVLLLVSADFHASDFIQERELPRIIKGHEREAIRVVPIVVRPSDSKGSYPDSFQCLPLDDAGNLKAVTLWNDQDAAWVTVVQELRRVLKRLEQRRRRARFRWLLLLLIPVLLFFLLRLTVIKEYTLHPTLPLAALPVLLVTPDADLTPGQLREQVATVIRIAGDRGVRAVFLDMDFSRENSLEAEMELRTALAQVHALPVPMAVIAMQSSEPQKTPLVQACDEQAQDCFDALVDPRFLERLEGLEPPWPVVNACPDHQPGLAWTLAALLSSPGWSEKPRPTLKQMLQEGCVSTWFRLRSAETGTETATEAPEDNASIYHVSIEAKTYLSPEPVMTPAPSVLLIAELDASRDVHEVMVMEPSPGPARLLGPQLQLLMARHLLASAQTRGAAQSAWSWSYRYFVRGGI